MSSGLGFCANCVSGFEIPGTPRGTMAKYGPYDTYVSAPPPPGTDAAARSDMAAVDGSDQETHDDVAIAFFPDAFGLGIKNNKVLADILAQRLRCRVFIVDYFNGKPVSESLAEGQPTTAEAANKQGILGKLGSAFHFAKAAPWFLSNMPGKTLPLTEQWLAALKEKEGIKRVGGVGYCYGGKPALVFNGKGLIDASVVCHPSFIGKADIEAIQKPALFLVAEHDPIFPQAMRNHADAVLRPKLGGDYNQIMYPNTVHGFAARPDLSDERVRAGFEASLTQTIAWFRRHIVDAQPT